MSDVAVDYKPIDIELGNSGTRILRCLRFFDWVSTTEVFEAMGIEEGVPKQKRRRRSLEGERIAIALRRLVADGFVERVCVGGVFYCRLSKSGRVELKRRLSALAVDMSEVEA